MYTLHICYVHVLIYNVYVAYAHSLMAYAHSDMIAPLLTYLEKKKKKKKKKKLTLCCRLSCMYCHGCQFSAPGTK